MDTLIIQSESNKTKAIASFLKAFDISFEIKKNTKKEDKPYDPEFVKMVIESSKNKVRIPYDENYKKMLLEGL